MTHHHHTTQHSFRTLTGGMYHGVSGVFCVYDITCQESFDKLGTWVQGTQRYMPGSQVVVSIVGNKTDLAVQRVVSTAQGKQFATDNKMQFYETSALTGENVMHAFEQLIEDILKARNGDSGHSKEGKGCCTLL